MEEQKDCRSPRSEAALPSPAPSPRGAVWSNRSRSSTPASTPRGDAAGGGEAPLAEEPKKPAKPAAPAPERLPRRRRSLRRRRKKPPAALETPGAGGAGAEPTPARRLAPKKKKPSPPPRRRGPRSAAGGDLVGRRRRRGAAACAPAAEPRRRAEEAPARAGALPPPRAPAPPPKAPAPPPPRPPARASRRRRRPWRSSEQARPRRAVRRGRARKAAVDIHRRAVNRWEGLEAEDAPAPAPRRRPAAAKDAVRKPPPVDAAPPKRAPAPKKAARKKKADDDAACLREYDGDRDLRERFFGCLSVVVALLVWGAPALAYVAREPHELSAARFHDVFPKPADLAILRPPHEGLTTDPMVEWQFGDALGRAAANGAVDVEVWLDRGMLLGGDAGRVQIPPQARARGSSDPEPYRLTYDLGSLQMGIHNVTVVLRSAEAPPRFAPVPNTSLFLTPRVERDADAAAAP
ncbi:hypothetical protein JL721_7498 [Aureococcus anophagefferens]|nr:hypothetical protein JL721_7498 [Aureococcus anophagefferens]